MKTRIGKIMTHIVAGYPSPGDSEGVARIMMECGVDFIEIQIPFSDPVADGAVIMQANEKALKNGIRVVDCFKLMRRLVHGVQSKTKFLFMSYFNILHNYGVEKFCKDAKKAGCYGLIVPDMPLDEEKNEKYLINCKNYDLMPIQVVSPLTPVERLKKIARVARGFVYCVSRYGTTGVNKRLNNDLEKYLTKVKKYLKKPLAVGFGISKGEHVQAVHKNAEIAVIGSKIIKMLNKKSGLTEVGKFLQSIKKAP